MSRITLSLTFMIHASNCSIFVIFHYFNDFKLFVDQQNLFNHFSIQFLLIIIHIFNLKYNRNFSLRSYPNFKYFQHLYYQEYFNFDYGSSYFPVFSIIN